MSLSRQSEDLELQDESTSEALVPVRVKKRKSHSHPVTYFEFLEKVGSDFESFLEDVKLKRIDVSSGDLMQTYFLGLNSRDDFSLFRYLDNAAYRNVAMTSKTFLGLSYANNPSLFLFRSYSKKREELSRTLFKVERDAENCLAVPKYCYTKHVRDVVILMAALACLGSIVFPVMGAVHEPDTSSESDHDSKFYYRAAVAVAAFDVLLFLCCMGARSLANRDSLPARLYGGLFVTSDARKILNLKDDFSKTPYDLQESQSPREDYQRLEEIEQVYQGYVGQSLNV